MHKTNINNTFDTNDNYLCSIHYNSKKSYESKGDKIMNNGIIRKLYRVKDIEKFWNNDVLDKEIKKLAYIIPSPLLTITNMNYDNKLNDIAKRIRHITDAEGFNITDEAINVVVRVADGSMRDALSLLDRCISVSSLVTVDTVSSSAGLMGR